MNQTTSSSSSTIQSCIYDVSQNELFKVCDTGPLIDNSYIFLSKESIMRRQLQIGKIVHIVCPKKRKDTIAILIDDQQIAQPQVVKMSHIMRKNLAAEVGDLVSVRMFKCAVEFSKLVVKKIGGCAPNATPQMHEQTELANFFSETLRPICRDDIFQIKTQLGIMEFMIVYTEPYLYGYVTEETLIAIDWEIQQK